MSISANIAEGSGKGSDKELVRFLRIALGSTSELENHLIIARDTSVLTKSDFDSLTARIIEVRKMLYGLVRYLSHSGTQSVESRSRTETIG